MHTLAKLGLTALSAALLLAAAVSVCSARSLSLSHQTIRVTWSRLDFVTANLTTRCQVTLEGSFHSRTVAKVERLLIGSVTSFLMRACTSGAGIQKIAPWHITYEGFTGTLPNISAIRILLSRFRFLLVQFGVVCELGNETDNITFSAARGAGGEVTTLTPVEGRNTAHLSNPAREAFGCADAKLVGSGDAVALNSTARITITLI